MGERETSHSDLPSRTRGAAGVPGMPFPAGSCPEKACRLKTSGTWISPGPFGRREKIRTSDPYHPKVVRYQAAPRAVNHPLYGLRARGSSLGFGGRPSGDGPGESLHEESQGLEHRFQVDARPRGGRRGRLGAGRFPGSGRGGSPGRVPPAPAPAGGAPDARSGGAGGSRRPSGPRRASPGSSAGAGTRRRGSSGGCPCCAGAGARE